MSGPAAFPLPLDPSGGATGPPLGEVLAGRLSADPMNGVATALFALAILHTFLAPTLLAWSHRLRRRTEASGRAGPPGFAVEALHLLGEVEVVFGLWVIPLLVALALRGGLRAPERFLGQLGFAEPIFVVVVMAVASTRPVLDLAERLLGQVARLGGGTPRAWWIATLVVGPLLGSLITEPAAMIICALLLSQRVFALEPSPALRYATLGLLFVNVSVGGTLTHFAAPPVLMVAARFGWDTPFMLAHFGWKAAAGIALGTALTALALRRDLAELQDRASPGADTAIDEAPLPAWITAVHLVFLGLAVLWAHAPPLLIGAFLF
jgi:hypothetical protein